MDGSLHYSQSRYSDDDWFGGLFDIQHDKFTTLIEQNVFNPK